MEGSSEDGTWGLIRGPPLSFAVQKMNNGLSLPGKEKRSPLNQREPFEMVSKERT